MERDAFRTMNRLMLLAWRAGLGAPINATHRLTGRIMVLGTVGRKSGLMRRTPLNYAPGADEVYALAGFGPRTDWYRNLQEHPFAELWLPTGCWLAEAEEVREPGDRLRAVREVLQASGFAAKAFAGVDPWHIADDDLERVTADYGVVRLRIVEPLPEADEMKVGKAARRGLVAGLALALAWGWLRRNE